MSEGHFGFVLQLRVSIPVKFHLIIEISGICWPGNHKQKKDVALLLLSSALCVLPGHQIRKILMKARNLIAILASIKNLPSFSDFRSRKTTKTLNTMREFLLKFRQKSMVQHNVLQNSWIWILLSKFSLNTLCDLIHLWIYQKISITRKTIRATFSKTYRRSEICKGF